MKKVNKEFYFKLLISISLISPLLGAVFTGCKVEAPSSIYTEDITFVDYADASKLLHGREGVIDFGEKLVQMGARSVEPLKIENSGEDTLAILDMTIDGAGFGFVDDISPDFPLIIPAGKIIDDVFLEFAPETAGDFTGMLYIETEGGTRFFELAGIGLWQLTLTVSNVDPDDNGKITSPVEVIPGAPPEVLTSSTGIFKLACEIDPFNDLVAWVATPNPANPDYVAPDFENVEAKETMVVLNSHTEITLDINLFFQLLTGNITGAQLQTAIDTVSGDPASWFGVIVGSGTCTVTTNVTLKANAPVFGGYQAGPALPREYLTEADRASSATIIDVQAGGSITADSTVGSNVMLEGFTINKTAGNNDPLLSFTNGTGAILQYNTITSLDGAPAVVVDNASNLIQYNVITGGNADDLDNSDYVYAESIPVLVTNGAVPRILNNVITAGTTNDPYSKTYGIKITEGAEPVIYKNSIDAGTAGGTGADSYAIFSDFECISTVWGNTLDGGVAAGSGGKSYGLYILNNGRIYAAFNEVNGGAGESSYASYVGYGGNLYLDYNNLFTEAASTTRHAVYIGPQGRVRRIENNGLYDCPDSLLHTPIPPSDETSIDGVNDYFRTDSNRDERISYTTLDLAE